MPQGEVVGAPTTGQSSSYICETLSAATSAVAEEFCFLNRRTKLLSPREEGAQKDIYPTLSRDS